MDDDRDLWWVALRPLPGPVPGDVRVRRALKALLRAYGLKVEFVGARPPALRSRESDATIGPGAITGDAPGG